MYTILLFSLLFILVGLGFFFSGLIDEDLKNEGVSLDKFKNQQVESVDFEFQKLHKMYSQQKHFMQLLKQYRNFPNFPVALSSKDGQKLLKHYTHECMHELFEANQMLKNSKDHRATQVLDFDKDKYLEELSDALHYFFEIVILSGISPDELYESYMKKGTINIDRIKNGY
jgi:uncharacterized protein YktA (UPF0223 family)